MVSCIYPVTSVFMKVGVVRRLYKIMEELPHRVLDKLQNMADDEFEQLELSEAE